MIINKAHDFGFVHIPKCAGSSVRHQLRHLDDLEGRFYQTLTLPDLRRINANHVPLSILQSHFPDVLAQLEAVTSYAIVREPHDRFRSAVAQYLRAHIGEPSALSQAEITGAVSGIIKGILDDPDGQDIRNTVFFKQVDFVYLNGVRVIEHVHAMDQIDTFFDRLAEQHNLTLECDQVWNPTVTYRWSGSTDFLIRSKDIARKTLPTQSYAKLRDWGIRLLTKKGSPQLEAALSTLAEVRSFVEDYYVADLALYRAAQGAGAPERHP